MLSLLTLFVVGSGIELFGLARLKGVSAGTAGDVLATAALCSYIGGRVRYTSVFASFGVNHVEYFELSARLRFVCQ